MYAPCMPRSKVRTGAFDARDRATKRRRRRRRPPAAVEEHSLEWLEPVVRGLKIEDAERIDLRGFLRDTAEVELPAQRRLAELGFSLMSELPGLPVRRAWAAVSRVYEEALRIEASDALVYCLQGLAAIERAIVEQEEERRWLLDMGLQVIRQGLTIDAEDAELHYLLGYALYDDGAKQAERALASFEAALLWDSGHRWALLHKAYCLQDLERWERAAEAYEQVPRERFQGLISWRMDLLIEQRAWCLLKSGRQRDAREDFERLLTRYEREPRLAEWMTLQYFESALAWFPDLEPRLRRLEAVRGALDP